MTYDLTVNRLLEILTEMRVAGHGESKIVLLCEEEITPMPISGISDSFITTAKGRVGKQNVIDEEKGTPVIVFEHPRASSFAWFEGQNCECLDSTGS